MKKKKKHHTIIYYATICLLILLFITMSVSVITLQTGRGREKIKSAFIKFAKKNNINLKIESIKGAIPFEYEIRNLTLISQNRQIDIEKIECKIRLFPLLQ